MKEQIEQFKNDIAECYGCDPMYYGVDANFIAESLVGMNWRKQEWISVADRLPEVRQRVLLYSYHDGINTGYRADEIGRFYVDKSYPYRPTYWMPLPEPPKMKGGAE